MSEDLSLLSDFAGTLVQRCSGPSRRQLAREIARRLRESQSKRIAAQQNPDGSPYEPRKNTRLQAKKGAVRRKMFSKLRTAKWLKTMATPEAAVVAFAAQVQHMAQVHQQGLRDKVKNKNGSGPEVVYPKRVLLGFTQAEVDAVGEMVLNHLAGR